MSRQRVSSEAENGLCPHYYSRWKRGDDYSALMILGATDYILVISCCPEGVQPHMTLGATGCTFVIRGSPERWPCQDPMELCTQLRNCDHSHTGYLQGCVARPWAPKTPAHSQLAAFHCHALVCMFLVAFAVSLL